MRKHIDECGYSCQGVTLAFLTRRALTKENTVPDSSEYLGRNKYCDRKNKADNSKKTGRKKLPRNQKNCSIRYLHLAGEK